MSMRTYSTAQAAKLLKIGRATLHRWMRAGVVPVPLAQRIGGVAVRLWTAAEVQEVRNQMPAHYRKGRGRKKGNKSKG